jgi:hypothetical protein
MPLHASEVKPPLLAAGWFAEGDIPGHEALVAYRDALLVWGLAQCPPQVRSLLDECRVHTHGDIVASYSPFCAVLLLVVLRCEQGLRDPQRERHSTAFMPSWSLRVIPEELREDGGEGDLAAVCVGILGIPIWRREQRESVPGGSSAVSRDEYGVGRGPRSVEEKLRMQSAHSDDPFSLHPVLDASLNFELALAVGSAARHKGREGGAASRKPASPSSRATKLEVDSSKASVLAGVRSPVLQTSFQSAPLDLLTDTSAGALRTLVTAVQVRPRCVFNVFPVMHVAFLLPL